MFCSSPAAGVLLVGLALATAGCGDSSDAAPLEPVETVSCLLDPRLDTYTPDMDKLGELGVLSFRFSELSPDPPAKGSNEIVVQVNDAAGAVMTGALEVDLRMPDHGHGTSVEPVVSFDAALGRHRISPLFLFMPGVWRIDFDAYAGPEPTQPPLDRVTLHFCIEG